MPTDALGAPVALDDIVTMDPKIKARWVADLRSGERKQGNGFLQTCDDEFCCLGVLSDLAVDDGVISKSEGRGFYRFGDKGDSAALPDSVIEWANVYIEGNLYGDVVGKTRYGRLPFYNRNGTQAYLDDLNDSGMPFHQIADVIDYWY